MRSSIAAWLTERFGPLGAVLVPGWFAFAAFAGVVATLWIVRRARRAGDDVDAAICACVAAYVGGLTAGAVLPMLADSLGALASGDGLRLRWAGMTSYCGFGGAVVAIALALRKRSLALPRFLDLAAAPLALAMAIGRLGCFVAGCDFGQVTSAPWAVRFPTHSPAWNDHVHAGWLLASRGESLPVHPTQLYEAALCLAICVAAVVLERRRWARAHSGRIALVVVALYAVARFGVEALRGDAGRGFFGPLSSAQVTVLAAAALGCLYLARSRVRVAAIAALAVLCAAPVARADKTFEVAGSLAGAAPLNRRSAQVPSLGGFSLSGLIALDDSLLAGLDLDSLANEVATHATAAAVLEWKRPTSAKLDLGIRGGIGATLVDFSDPSFTDRVVYGARAGAVLDWGIAESWAITVRPFTLDVIGGEGLGAPVFTLQFRVGVRYRHGSATAATVAPAPRPAPVTTPPQPAPGGWETAPAAPAPAPPPAADPDGTAEPAADPQNPY